MRDSLNLYRGDMSRARKAVSAALVSLTLVAAIGGCTSDPASLIDPATSASPTPYDSPLSQEAALDEALTVINSYGKALAEVAGDRSVDVSVLTPYVTPGLLETQRSAVRELRDEGHRLVGLPIYSDAQVLQYDPGKRLSVILCRDISGIRLLDDAGNDVTPADRGDLFAMKMDLLRTDGTFKVDASDGWDGTPPC